MPSYNAIGKLIKEVIDLQKMHILDAYSTRHHSLYQFEQFLNYYRNELIKKQKYVPISISIDITSKCNLRCQYCYLKNSKRRELPIKIFTKLLEDAKKLGTIEIVVSGGEPFLRKDIKEIISKIKKHGFKLDILTNGTHISVDNLLNISKLLGPNDIIQVSLDGPTPEIHEIFRGKDTFTKSISTIKQLIDKNINVAINFTVNDNNYKYIQETYLMAASLGVLRFNVSPLIDFENISKNSFLNIEAALPTILEAEKMLLEKILKNKIKTEYTGILMGDTINFLKYIDESLLHYFSNSGCEGGKYKAHVDSEGKVYPCVFAVSPGLSAGDLSNSPFSYIWTYGNWMHFRDEQELPLKCRKCKYSGICSRCPGLTYRYYKSTYEKDPRCPF